MKQDMAEVLLIKYSICDEYDANRACLRQPVLHEFLLSARDGADVALLEEIVMTKNSIRSQANPKYAFDERWSVLEKSLLLDGYRIKDGQIHALDISMEGDIIDDDLDSIILNSGIKESSSIISEVRIASDCFTASPGEYVGCLTHMRIALHIAAESISGLYRGDSKYNSEEWGQVLANLRVSGIINKKQEKGLEGVYCFVSDGTHRPVGFDEAEYVRFVRSMALHMLYFLVATFSCRPRSG